MSLHLPPRQRLRAYSLLALSMALAGSYVALSRPLVAALPVFLLAWLRFGIGAVAMAGWLRKPADEPPLSVHTRWLLFLESFLGNFLFSICMLYGVSLSSAVSAGIIMATIPAVVALMSRVFLHEVVAPRIWAAIGFGAGGIALLAWSRAAQAPQGTAAIAGAAGADEWLGHALVFAAVLCEAFYAVIGKKLTGSLSPKRIAAVINLIGFALMTPMGLYLALGFDFGAVHAGSWALLVFYALAASVWTVWLWMTGARDVPGAHAGVFTVLMPVSTALVGVLVLGEPLGGLQLLALALALAGVLLATLPARQRAGAQGTVPLEPHV